MKKILALVLALTMVLAFAPLAFAAADGHAITTSKYYLNVDLNLGTTVSGNTVADVILGTTGSGSISAEGKPAAAKISVDFDKLNSYTGTTFTSVEDFWKTYGKRVTVWLNGFDSGWPATKPAALGGSGSTSAAYVLKTVEYSTNGGNTWTEIPLTDFNFGTSGLTAIAPKTVIGFDISLSGVGTVNYLVRLTSTDNTAGNEYWTETGSFSISFDSASKPVKDLKITKVSLDNEKELSTDDLPDFEIYPRDGGIWYADTSSFLDMGTIGTVDTSLNKLYQDGKVTLNVSKPDGSAFTNKAVSSVAIYDTTDGGGYATPNLANTINIKDGKFTFDFNGDIYTNYSAADVWQGTAATKPALVNTTKTLWAYVQVEDEGAIYRLKVPFMIRDGIRARNPEGVYFHARTITLAVNEDVFPAYVTNVDPLKDISKDVVLDYTANADRNVYSIVVKDGKYSIIGMKEGTSYVSLRYTYTGSLEYVAAPVIYGDTAKVVVTGVTPIEPGTKYVVTASTLNVRKGAGTGNAIVTTYKKGTVVEVVEIKDGWAKLSTGNYVSAQYLSKYSSSAVIGTKTVTARTLNVRAGAGTSYAITGKLTRGSKVDVVEIVAGGAWAKINYAGSVYYVSTAYLA
jgi:uncharacterized protein YraI